MEKINGKVFKLISIQALRAWAFLGIFLSHANADVSWPSLGVTVFFTLSGFLMYMKHSNDKFSLSLKDSFEFSWTRISKLYPLHIVTMCFALILVIGNKLLNGISIQDVFIIIAEILLNISLTQTWIPYSKINFSLNGVAWFLSVTMFLYFMFPRISMWIKKNSKKILLLICIGILISEIILCIPCIIILGVDSPIYIWFMYSFPIFRMGDFFIGGCLAKWYLERKNKKYNLNIFVASIIELIGLVITISVFMFLKIEIKNVYMAAIHNWTTIYIPIAAIWIILFAENTGIVTHILCNKLTIFIGNISTYLFLIHYVVTQGTKGALMYLEYEPNGMIKYIIITGELVISIILSFAYKRYKDRIKVL